MAKKAKKPAVKKAKASVAKKAKPAKALKAKPGAKAKPVAAAPEAPAKVLKPLTLKQKLSLIRIDPTTGRCPHGLAPETCAFCMSI